MLLRFYVGYCADRMTFKLAVPSDAKPRGIVYRWTLLRRYVSVNNYR